MDKFEEAVQRADRGEMVRFDTDLMRIERDRAGLHDAALRLTQDPIAIFTRTDKNFQVFFFVRKYDKNESIPYEQMEKEAREQGWIK